jgi:hypothetical protein
MKSAFLAALAVSSCLFASTALADTFLIVRTSGNVGGSGTDSNIYVRVSDADSTSKRLRLQDLSDSSDILENGAVEVFTIKDADLTTAILSVEVESDGQYPGADWHLESITAITADPANTSALSLAPLALTQILMGTYTTPFPGVLTSTFRHEDWIKGDTTHMANNELKPGVLLVRAEPVAQAQGAVETVNTTLYVVYSADALDSDQAVERAWETTISRTESLTLTDEQTDQATVGIEASVGYAASGDTGGVESSLTLSAEYQFVKAKTTEKVWGTEVSNATNDTFEAEAGTIQFRVLTTPGVIAKQSYISLIQDKTFVGRYVQEASPFVPTGVTFTKDKADDDKWNRSLARAFAVTQGKGGYDQMVSRLKQFGILSAPMTYEQAVAG